MAKKIVKPEKKQTIATLEPKEVWENFYALTQIPRPSAHTQKVAEFIRDFGKKLGLKSEIVSGNVIISKPATKGMEKCKGIILQGHMDMVPQKNNDKKHDFTKDPIEAYVDGAWVTADGTTLGADNGMGVAAAMAVLASKTLQHGPIEALFTFDEETEMVGAKILKPKVLKGDILLNLDSETEGEIYVGCAGGMNGKFTFTYKSEKVPTGYVPVQLNVTGLKGGHSGMDINLGRANANKVMFRLLKTLTNQLGARLASIDGGNMRNAIPREAVAVIAIDKKDESKLKKIVAEFQKTIFAEYGGVDEGVKVLIEKAPATKEVMDKKTQAALIDAIYACPHGVVRMSDAVPGLIETSNNLAIVKSGKSKVEVTCLMRSSVDSAKADLAEAMESVFRMAGAKCKFDGEYCGWKPNMKSAALAELKTVYKKLFKKDAAVMAIHAGLECAIMGGSYPNWDMVSFGPTIEHPHSPDERVNIESVAKFWKFITEILKNAQKK